MAKKRPKNQPPIPPAIAGTLGIDGGGWNLIKRPKTPEDLARTAEICTALFKSGNPDDRRKLNSLIQARATVREQQAYVQQYLLQACNHPALMEKLIEWGVENPGDFYKLAGQWMPKETSVEVTSTQERILKVEYSQNWEEAVKKVQQQVIEGEIVE